MTDKMADLPYMQLYPSDWLSDCQVLSIASRGAWQTIICKAWISSNRGVVSLKIAAFARLFGSTIEEALEAILEIEEMGIADISRLEDGRIEIVCRRIVRDISRMEEMAKNRSERAKTASRARWDAKKGLQKPVNGTPKESSDNAPSMHQECGKHDSSMTQACSKDLPSNGQAILDDAILEARSQKLEARSQNLKTSTPKTPKSESGKKFKKPEILQVAMRFSYLGAISKRISTELAEKFVAHYESNGWKVGKVPMKSWESACVTWKSNNKELFEKKEKRPSEPNGWKSIANDIEPQRDWSKVRWAHVPFDLQHKIKIKLESND